MPPKRTSAAAAAAAAAPMTAAAAVTQDVAYAIDWKILKKMMTDKYCPRGEIKKLEIKLWNLKVKGIDVASYTLRFQELGLMCGRMFHKESEEPKTMKKAIEFANDQMDKKVLTITERQAEQKRKLEFNAGNSQGCNKCKKVGHLARDSRSSGPNNNNNNRGNSGATQNAVTCYECGVQGHYKKDCPKLTNGNHGNQRRNGNAPAKVYVVGNAGTNPDSNVVTGTFILNNRYASILFDTGADRSLVSTTFSSLIDITPTTLDACWLFKKLVPKSPNIQESNGARQILDGRGLESHGRHIEAIYNLCMRTRSQSRNSNRQQQQVNPTFVEPFNLVEPIENQAPPVVTMADNRTMAQLLEAPTEGYEDAIVVPEITADNFELKHDSLNSVTGGNFLDKMPRDCLRIIESKSKVRNSRNKQVVAKVGTSTSTSGISPEVAALTTDVAELKDMMKTLILDKQKSQAPATVKAVEEKCVTCGGAHSYPNCHATDGNVYHDNIQEYVSQAAVANFNQGNTGYRPSMVANQIRPPGFPPISQPLVYQALQYQAPAPQTQGVTRTNFESYVKAKDAVMQNIQTNITTLTNSNLELKNMFSQLIKINTASSLGTGSLPSNTVTNPKEDLKGITTRSGVAYQGPTIPTTSPKFVERRTEVTKDTVFPTNNGITEDSISFKAK
ncbi:reverse transcriptase domain-containing protein [Tanacetum coccineum]